MKRVEITADTYINGTPIATGQVLELEDPTAIQLITNSKARLALAVTAPAAEQAAGQTATKRKK